jgi:hypothetical protein
MILACHSRVINSLIFRNRKVASHITLLSTKIEENPEDFSSYASRKLSISIKTWIYYSHSSYFGSGSCDAITITIT